MIFNPEITDELTYDILALIPVKLFIDAETPDKLLIDPLLHIKLFIVDVMFKLLIIALLIQAVPAVKLVVDRLSIPVIIELLVPLREVIIEF